jgi:hypothetical protein
MVRSDDLCDEESVLCDEENPASAPTKCRTRTKRNLEKQLRGSLRSSEGDTRMLLSNCWPIGSL